VLLRIPLQNGRVENRRYTEQDIETAIAYFRQAMEKDPAYAEAYAGLANVLSNVSS
jgi:Tfp pilus assembly protein PilF